MSGGRASGTRLDSGTAGGWSTMMGPCWVLAFGGHRGSSFRGGDVPVTMHDRQWFASPSVHRQSVGQKGYVTEIGTHSAKLCRRTSVTPQRSSWVRCSRARCHATTGAGGAPDSAVTVEVPQLQSSTAVDTPVVAQVPQLQFIDSCRHSCCGAEANPGIVHTLRKPSIFHRCSFWLGF